MWQNKLGQAIFELIEQQRLKQKNLEIFRTRVKRVKIGGQFGWSIWRK